MLTIYILSGKVFGKDIYEIDCTLDINHRRFFSEKTGFPESNMLHYSSCVDHVDLQSCRNMIIDSLYYYRMKKGQNFYKINLSEAITHLEKIELNINYSYHYKMEQKLKEKKTKKQSCF